jgi:hypothetical protein
MKRIRIQINNVKNEAGKPGMVLGVRAFIVRDELGVVHMTSPDGTPEAMANIFHGDAQHVRFSVEDARDDADAVKVIRAHLAWIYHASIWGVS